MKTNHTQGEWHLSQSPPARSLSKSNGIKSRIFKSIKNTKTIGGNIIANAYGDTIEEAEANAKLISASPDMYEVLKELLEYFQGWNGHGNYDSKIEKIIKTIAKAGGK